MISLEYTIGITMFVTLMVTIIVYLLYKHQYHEENDFRFVFGIRRNVRRSNIPTCDACGNGDEKWVLKDHPEYADADWEGPFMICMNCAWALKHMQTVSQADLDEEAELEKNCLKSPDLEYDGPDYE